MFIYFFSLTGIIRLQNFLKEAEENRWRVHIHKFNKDIPYRKIFWELKKEYLKQNEQNLKIVLDVGRRNLYEALKQVIFVNFSKVCGSNLHIK